MDIRFVATRLGQQPEILLLPLRLDIPFIVYGIPMKLSLGANLSVTPELTGESSSEVEFNLKYSGSTGFDWSLTTARALGGLDTQALSLLTGDTAGFGPVGLGVRLAFPVMQLRVLEVPVVTSMVIDTHVATPAAAMIVDAPSSRPSLGRRPDGPRVLGAPTAVDRRNCERIRVASVRQTYQDRHQTGRKP